jgi:chromosomal replication initiation ATPase DnaA
MSETTRAPVLGDGRARPGEDPTLVGQLFAVLPGEAGGGPRGDQAADSLWTAIVASLDDVGATHKAWLAQTRPVAIVADTLVVAVQDQFVKDWIQQHCLQTLIDVLTRVAAQPLNIQLTVEPGGSAADAAADAEGASPPGAGEEAAAQARAKAEAAASQLEGRWQAACPRKFWGTRLASVPVPDQARARAARYARHLVDGKAGNLVITGSKGVAKTGLALAIGRVAMEAGQTLRFTPAYDLLLELRSSYSAAIRHYTQPDVLILEFDELLHDPNDWQAEQFFGLVNRRDLDAKPIIVTTNRPPYDVRLEDGTVVVGLASLLSPATWDRLQEAAEIITIIGPSLRRPKPRLEPVDGAAAGEKARP